MFSEGSRRFSLSFSLIVSCSVVSNSLQPHGLQPTKLICLWNSPSKNTGVGRHSLLQGIFPIWGLNPRLLHCRQILYCLSHQGSPIAIEVLFTQSCPTLCDPMDYSPPGSSTHGISQARILEGIAISFSNCK